LDKITTAEGWLYGILCYVCQNTAAHELNMLGKQ